MNLNFIIISTILFTIIAIIVIILRYKDDLINELKINFTYKLIDQAVHFTNWRHKNDKIKLIKMLRYLAIIFYEPLYDLGVRHFRRYYLFSELVNKYYPDNISDNNLRAYWYHELNPKDLIEKQRKQ